MIMMTIMTKESESMSEILFSFSNAVVIDNYIVLLNPNANSSLSLLSHSVLSIPSTVFQATTPHTLSFNQLFIQRRIQGPPTCIEQTLYIGKSRIYAFITTTVESIV